MERRFSHLGRSRIPRMATWLSVGRGKCWKLALVVTIAPPLFPPALCAQDLPPSVQRYLQEHSANRLRFINSATSHGWLQKAQQLQRENALALTHTGPENIKPLRGVHKMVVLPGTYSDVEPPFSAAEYQTAFFGAQGALGRYSLSEWYSEVSGGLFTFGGTTTEWIRLDNTRSYYGDVAVDPYRGRLAEYISDVLERADALVDWTQFDNDGPDGVSNSGDDDGFVDMVSFMTPLRDGCSGDLKGLAATGSRVTWALGAAYETDQPGANGQPLKVDDFVFHSGAYCRPSGEITIADMGLVIHEMGHALGLPDLYDYDGSSLGVGGWDPMGLAWWSPEGRPTQFGAWTRTALGWSVVDTTPDTLYTLPPVETSRRVLQITIPGTEEYLLLENKQRIDADEPLGGTGLLVWHIDPVVGRERNWVPYVEDRPAVGLVQADGRRDLALNANWGDDGDPFPGSSGNRRFADETTPSTMSNSGTPSGISIYDIEQIGLNVSFRIGVLVSLGDAVDHLLVGGSLTSFQESILDAVGNRDGTYDLGDVLAWLDRCEAGAPDCAASAAAMEAVQRLKGSLDPLEVP